MACQVRLQVIQTFVLSDESRDHIGARAFTTRQPEDDLGGHGLASRRRFRGHSPWGLQCVEALRPEQPTANLSSDICLTAFKEPRRSASGNRFAFVPQDFHARAFTEPRRSASINQKLLPNPLKEV